MKSSFESDRDEYYSFYYKSSTKTVKPENSQDECVTATASKCDQNGCALGESVSFTDCLDYDVEMIVIVVSVVGTAFAISIVVMVSCFIARNKKRNGSERLVSSVPLNTANESETNQQNEYTDGKSFGRYANQQNYLNPIEYPQQA